MYATLGGYRILNAVFKTEPKIISNYCGLHAKRIRSGIGTVKWHRQIILFLKAFELLEIWRRRRGGIYEHPSIDNLAGNPRSL